MVTFRQTAADPLVPQAEVIKMVNRQPSGGVVAAVLELTGGSLDCLISLSSVTGELLRQVGQYVVDGAEHGAAACDPRECLLRDLADLPVQVQRGEPEAPV